ncbi:MAG: hypothetical protein P3X22_005040 [Thermoprotei archaeon]|nr:hypothetical protein [Thermoprotei archaeon]
MEAISRSYREGVEELKRHLASEASLLPEFMDGLTSIYEETEDYTCHAVKKLLGKREKGVQTMVAKDPVESREEGCISSQG